MKSLANRQPGDSFLWRLSIADVATDGDFSLFPGIDRTISLIQGAGMELDFAEAPGKRIDRTFKPFEFSGDWRCRCRLIDGPIRDFNLMVDRSRLRATTTVIRLAQTPVDVEARLGPLLIYCGEGALQAGDFAAEAGDTLKLEPGRYTIAAGKALALVMRLHMLRGR